MEVDRIKQLEADKEALLDEIDVLKSALVEAASYPREWHLTRREADLLGMLVKRPVARTEAMMAVLYSDRIAAPSPDIIKVWVCKMRKKLALVDIKIETVWGVGYSIDTETRLRVIEQSRTTNEFTAASAA